MRRLAVALLGALAFAATVSTAAKSSDKISGLPGGYPDLMSTNYAGYINIPNSQRKSFYWFVESESEPTRDPLVLWLNGGPGCSSMLGMFTEIGPYLLRNFGVWERNSFAWNKQANVLFVESPAGVGFSIDQTPPTVWDDAKTASLNYDFLKAWLESFPEYKGRDFFIAGESYAGHYIPQLAKKIVDGDSNDLKTMFKGFMAGNPCTGAADGSNLDWCFVDNDPTLTEFRKSHGLQSYDTRIPWTPGNRDTYDPYNFLVRTCGDNLDGLQARTLRPSAKQQAELMPASALVMEDAPVSGADMLHGGAYGPCSEQHLTEFLRRPDVIAAIHATAPAGGWGACANIQYPIYNTTPGVLPTYRYLMANSTIKMMIYSGTADTVVNFIQSQKILNSLNMPVVQDFTAWYYQDLYNASWKQLGGYFNIWDRISWAGVRGAGHMVPSYVPAPAYQLFWSFLTTGKPGLAPPNETWTPPNPWESANRPVPTPAPAPPAPPAATSGSTGRDVGLVLGGALGGVLVALVGQHLAVRRFRRSGGGGGGGSSSSTNNAELRDAVMMS